MTTASNMNITDRYYLNCTQTVSLTMNDTVTIPFWSNDTTATLSTMSETNEIKIMFTMIGVMVMLVILCAAAYQLYSSEKYYDSFKETIVHIALTLYAQLLARGKPDPKLEYALPYLTLIEATLEAAPLLTIQLYLFITDTHTDNYQTITTEMTTQFGWDSNITPWHRNCNKTSTSLMNSASTTPFWNFETTSGVYYHDHGKFIINFGSKESKCIRIICYAQVLASGKSDINSDWVVYISSYLTLVEATLESAPQLTIQINLLITDMHTDTTYSRILRYVSITTSFLGLAWSLNAFKHQHRKKEQMEDDSMLVKLVHWISRFAEILPRIILIALVAAEYIVILGFILQPSFLFLYYRLRRTQHEPKKEKKTKKSYHKTTSPDISTISSDRCIGDRYQEQDLQKHQNTLHDPTKSQQSKSKIDQHCNNQENRQQSLNYDNAQLINNYNVEDERSNFSQLQKFERSYQNYDEYPVERQHFYQDHKQPLDNDNSQLGNNYNVRYGRVNISHLQKYERSHQTNEQYPVERQNNYQDRQQPLNKVNSQLGNSFDFRNERHNYSRRFERYSGERQNYNQDRQQPIEINNGQVENHYNYNVRDGRQKLQRYERSNQTEEQFSGEPQKNNQYLNQALDYDNGQLVNTFDLRDKRQNNSQFQRCERSYQRGHRYSGVRNNGFESHGITDKRSRSTNLYSDERQNVGQISNQDTTQMQHRGNNYSQRGWYNNPSTSIGWPAAANNHKSNFASRFHNQSFVGNGGRVNSVGQYDSHEEHAFSGY
ncbi:unnamed protein product [Mytilus edulis]|uniref:XK-related protein n=1 Tax=Mytilus edulis TaxID=6550 RepID=A0A8S3RCQ8_MYTED|nr:unnamed protein product [Mytilus edulis]